MGDCTCRGAKRMIPIKSSLPGALVVVMGALGENNES